MRRFAIGAVVLLTPLFVGCIAQSSAADGADGDADADDLPPIVEPTQDEAIARLRASAAASHHFAAAIVVGGDASGDTTDAASHARFVTLMQRLDVAFRTDPALDLATTSPATGFSRYELSAGRLVSGLSFRHVARLVANGERLGPFADIEEHETAQIVNEVAARMAHTYLTFTNANADIDSKAKADVSRELYVYFGAGRDPAPHRWATQHADLVLYDGPSYIGFGPLDPSRYAADDFLPSYQVVASTSCFTYSPDARSFFTHKPSSSLAIITFDPSSPTALAGIDDHLSALLSALFTSRTPETGISDAPASSSNGAREIPVTAHP